MEPSTSRLPSEAPSPMRGSAPPEEDWEGRGAPSASFPLAPILVLRGRSLVCLLLLFLSTTARARRLPDIYWNSTNPIFRVDNTDHVMGVEIRDRLSFVCPFYDPDSLFTTADLEYSEIYRVPKWSYESCELSGEARLVGVCRHPHQPTQIGVVFREFTPVPGGLEYRPGEAYYFISTSNGSVSGISNRQGGLCRRKNVRLKIEILNAGKWASAESIWKGGKGGGLAGDATPPPQPTASPTPLMYIIHTRSPDDDLRRPREDDYDLLPIDSVVTAEEDDDGGGGVGLRPSALLLLASSLLLLPVNLVPHIAFR